MRSLSDKETYHLSVLGVMVGVGSIRKVGGGRSQPRRGWGGRQFLSFQPI